jgi:hypothetical protein
MIAAYKGTHKIPTQRDAAKELIHTIEVCAERYGSELALWRATIGEVCQS